MQRCQVISRLRLCEYARIATQAAKCLNPILFQQRSRHPDIGDIDRPQPFLRRPVCEPGLWCDKRDCVRSTYRWVQRLAGIAVEAGWDIDGPIFSRRHLPARFSVVITPIKRFAHRGR